MDYKGLSVGNNISEYFPVEVGLREGCVMSPWFYNMYMDGVVKEVYVRMLGTKEEQTVTVLLNQMCVCGFTLINVSTC